MAAMMWGGTQPEDECGMTLGPLVESDEGVVLTRTSLPALQPDGRSFRSRPSPRVAFAHPITDQVLFHTGLRCFASSPELLCWLPRCPGID
ncbi:hypothetical protein BJX96DRAFT_123490 [Aspergillus floccosus]